jgi:ATP adenylyltransferase
MDYIRGLGDQPAGCFLCHNWAKTADGDDAANFVLWRTESSMAMLNRFPYNNGHLLIAPARHVGGLEQLDEAELLDLFSLARDAQQVLGAAIGAQGFNLGANFGRCAGAGLPDHLHLHIVPRWPGDVNYMTVLDDVRVVPQSLATTYAELLAKAAELGLPKKCDAGTPGRRDAGTSRP